ncbi:hypothetical protein P5775_07390 [Bacillus cereus]|nr:hypothetical protein [Bacillus cereus]
MAQWEEVVGKRTTCEAVEMVENVGEASVGRGRRMRERGSGYVRGQGVSVLVDGGTEKWEISRRGVCMI